MTTEQPQPKTAVEHFNASAESYEKYTGGCTRELAIAILNLPQLADVGAPGSVILDNACGTGIVTAELIQRHLLLNNNNNNNNNNETNTTTAPITIHATDAAPNMLTLTRQTLSTLPAPPPQNQKNKHKHKHYTTTTHLTPSEHLPFPDHTFTHSLTNLGIPFFTSPTLGAAEIYRTLRPSNGNGGGGGVAVVTSWTDLGYLAPLRAAQRAVRPDDPPYQVPLAAEWFEAGYLGRVMARAGFGEDGVVDGVVEVEGGVRVHYGAGTVDGVVELLMHSFRGVWAGWGEGERGRFGEVLREEVGRVVEEYVMPGGERGVGIPMVAAVAVCRK